MKEHQKEVINQPPAAGPDAGETSPKAVQASTAGRTLVAVLMILAASGAATSEKAHAQEEYLDDEGQGFLEYSISGFCDEDGDPRVEVVRTITDGDDMTESAQGHVGILQGSNPNSGEHVIVGDNLIDEGQKNTRRIPWNSLGDEENDTLLLSQAVEFNEDSRSFDSDENPDVVYGPVREIQKPCGSGSNGDTDSPEDGTDDAAIRTEQHAGPTPAHTAVEASMEEFSDGEAGMAVLATDETYADALAGGPLATQVGGPILYADSEGLPNVTAQELQRLGTREVLLLGGEDALSRNVSDRLRNIGVTVTRIAGATRFETAAEIEEYIDEHTLATTREVFLANGTTFADANAVAGLAAQQEGNREAAILLTTAEGLHEATRRRLQERRAEIDYATAVGGVAVIRSGVLRESGDAASAETDRVAGRNRYETSAAVMRRDFRFHGNETADGQPSIFSAPASSFHAALAAAPIESRQDNAALSLVPESDERLLAPFEQVIRDFKHTSWTDARIIGDVNTQVRHRLAEELAATPPVNQ